MKRLLFLVAVFMLPFMIGNSQQIGDDIVKALSKGDANTVAKYFDSSVDVTILNTSDTYSKSQAQQVLKSFFSKHSVSDFKVLHNIDSKSGSSESVVGQLTSGKKSFRVYVLFSNSGSSKIIQEISIRER